MADIEGRLAVVEVRVQDFRDDIDAIKAGLDAHRGALHSQGAEIRQELAAQGTALRADMGELGTQLRADMAGMRSELKAEMGGMRSELKAELAGLRLEQRTDMAQLRGLLLAMDEKFDRRFEAADRKFFWVMGWQIMTLLAIVGGLFGVIAQLR